MIIRMPAEFSSLEKSIYNRIAARLLPFLFVLYVIAFIDRVNVSFAKFSMGADIGMSDQAYGLGAGICFLGICIFEIPSNIMLQRVGARFWLARIMVVWGLCCIAMSWVQSPTSFYVLRFALGAAEAGLFPGVMYYLAVWFPTKLRAQATTLFALGLPVSGIVGAPICGWIMAHMGGVGIFRDWQWLFILTGIPAVAMGFATYLFLVDAPDEAAWLTPQDKEVIFRVKQREPAMPSHDLKHGRLRAALFNKTLWSLSLVNFAVVIAIYSVAFWFPQMVNSLGIQDKFVIGLIVSIPSIAGGAGLIIIGQSSDRRAERRWHMVACLLMASIGLALAGWSATNLALLVFSVSLAMFGLMTSAIMLSLMPGLLVTGVVAAAGFALVSSVGNAAGIVGPPFVGWVMKVTGHIEYSFLVFGGMTLLGAATIAMMPGLGQKAVQALPSVAKNIE